MQKELQDLFGTGVHKQVSWATVEAEINCKWLFWVKKASGTPVFKARMIVKGCSQDISMFRDQFKHILSEYTPPEIQSANSSSQGVQVEDPADFFSDHQKALFEQDTGSDLIGEEFASEEQHCPDSLIKALYRQMLNKMLLLLGQK